MKILSFCGIWVVADVPLSSKTFAQFSITAAFWMLVSNSELYHYNTSVFCVVINLAGAILHKLLHFKYADNCLSCELHWCTWESERKQENSMASVWNISFNLYISVLFLELITLPKKQQQQIIKSINTYIKSLFCSLPAISYLSRLFLLCAVLWQHKFWGETQSLKLY